MNIREIEEKKQLILDQEIAVAKSLARQVLERPTPPIWMIFIPIFFVFHAWRIRQYGTSLKTFAENHLHARRCALDAAASALASSRSADLEELVAEVTDLPPQALAPYRLWLDLLIEHYSRLLASRGSSYTSLLRHSYAKREALQQAFARLAKAEQELRLALLKTLEGDGLQLQKAVDNIEQQLAALKQNEVQEAFPQ